MTTPWETSQFVAPVVPTSLGFGPMTRSDSAQREPLELASAQDTWTTADWEAAVAGVLRKMRRMSDDDPDDLVWQKLTHTTLDGIPVTPLGTSALLGEVRTAGRPPRAGAWDIRSRLSGAGAKTLREEGLAELEGGANSLWVTPDAAGDLATVLDGVFLDLAPVVLDAADDPLGLAREFAAAHAADAELAPGTNLGADAATTDADDLVAVARLAERLGTLGVVVDATAIHDRGASDVQELAWSIATGVATLRTLTAAGLDVTTAAGLLEFRYAAGCEQFATIAKLRAARRLWARVLQLSGVEETGMRLHAVTGRPMMTRYDPYVNMLRTCVAAFAAGVGGADAVTVLPFDSTLGRPDEFGRRIARNLNHLLIEESHVAMVADPAGGAYAVEKLTDDVALAAWDLFGRLDAGEDLQPLIEQVVAEREQQVATRRRPITGLTEFPNLAEQLPERQPDPTDDWARVRRYGASFEALRDEPAPRTVFLATLGPIAGHTARATYATNLFAAGGIKVVEAGATSGVDELVAAYRRAPGPVACLAGSDEAYAEWGAEAAAALREAGAEHVIIAGRPAEYADDNAATGVDVLAFLTRTRRFLGSVEGEKLA